MDEARVIAKSYDPTAVEPSLYAQWLANGCFQQKQSADKEGYSIVIPPPNVTGVLHIGHILNNTIQDVLIRRARHQGKNAWWVPGTDHAGISMQVKVEQELKKIGKNRHDLGREAFLEFAKQWRDKHGGIILQQLKSLGVSCDWDRTVHTLDDDYSEAVLTAFVELYKRGYVYRGKRIVNWCPVSLTALSDEEVFMRPQQGFLYKVRYELVNEPGKFLEVCTTRPETIMGDVALAVHPSDARYMHLIGQSCWRPFPRVAIPIIADNAIDPTFGTGILKVTPAHDIVDFEIGQRHHLPVIDVMNPDGTLNALAGEHFNGMERFRARDVAAQKLQSLGLLAEKTPYENNVGFSERSGVPIEPRLSEQWFVKYPKIDEAMRVVESGMIQFWPKRWEKTYTHWLTNVRDWCVSRQLWWGHRIPVWYRKGADRTLKENMHVSVKGPNDPENWEQDEDVLDTWASSWVWPMGVMGWPNAERMQRYKFDQFYPTADLVTGPDIIFFWVARMIIAGMEFMGDQTKLSDADMRRRIPFSNVYFTGIVRDAQGRKMSKSLGNSPDPLDLIQKYGADGLRVGLLSIAAQGQDVLFDETKIQQGRNFCNKLWNACRFRQMSGPIAANSLEHLVEQLSKATLDDLDRDMLGRLLNVTRQYEKTLTEYEFNSTLLLLDRFFWVDFCDWYLEVSKIKIQNGQIACLLVQDICLRQILLMLHPFAPFITDSLWRDMGFGSNFIQDQTWQASELEHALKNYVVTTTAVDHLREFVVHARALKAGNGVSARKDMPLLYTAEPSNAALLQRYEGILRALIGVQSFAASQEAPNGPAAVATMGTLWIVLPQASDAERERLQKELAQTEEHVRLGETKLQNEKFISSAPAKVVEGAKAQLEAAKRKCEELRKLLH